jgi:hypothetical protein
MINVRTVTMLNSHCSRLAYASFAAAVAGEMDAGAKAAASSGAYARERAHPMSLAAARAFP